MNPNDDIARPSHIWVQPPPPPPSPPAGHWMPLGQPQPPRYVKAPSRMTDPQRKLYAVLMVATVLLCYVTYAWWWAPNAQNSGSAFDVLILAWPALIAGWLFLANKVSPGSVRAGGQVAGRNLISFAIGYLAVSGARRVVRDGVREGMVQAMNDPRNNPMYHPNNPNRSPGVW
jgi:hypothetical protein